MGARTVKEPSVGKGLGMGVLVGARTVKEPSVGKGLEC